MKIILFISFFSCSVIALSQNNKLPVRFSQSERDSLLRVWEQKKHERALLAFENLKKNSRKDTLETVDFTDLRLKLMPDLIYECTNVKSIRLSGNSITRLPKRLKELQSLEALSWNHSDLSYLKVNNDKLHKKIKIPKGLAITRLELIGNQFTKFPRSIKRLRGLKELSLANNLIKVPPSYLKKSFHLSRLTLDVNPLDLSLFKVHKLPKNLELLQLNKCGISNFPRAFYQTKLKGIQLRENNLTELPDGISQMDSLSSLVLYKNMLKKLPSDFYELSQLSFLDLYYNELEYISSKIKDFNRLTVLYLSNNKLYDLPAEIGEMKNLEELYIHHNNLNSMPDSFGSLKFLKVLRFNDNNFTTFPAQVLSMESLEILDVSRNLLETIPSQIGEMKNLKSFSFISNAIELRSEKNVHIAPMVSEMMKKGVRCNPSIDSKLVEN